MSRLDWFALLRTGSDGFAAGPYAHVWAALRRELPSAADLIFRMCRPDPAERLTIPQALTHEFFAQAARWAYVEATPDGPRHVPLVPRYPAA